MTRKGAAIVAVAAACVLTIAVAAATPAAAAAGGSRRTREYVDAAGQSDAFEMLGAQTALSQSSDPQVRTFAKRMIEDHGRLGEALRQAAARSGVRPPPMGVGAEQAPLLGALQGLKGPEFDKAYWHHQSLAHRSALTATRRYASDGDDPAIQAAAVAALQVIASHLEMAQRMEAMQEKP